tara:strand:- start:308 stop:2701 length:2394 start_codon:yes stop_codon:yes gene_type:complete
MGQFHNNWRNFLAEGSFKEEKLLREVTTDEFENIRKALDEMEPKDWAFNDVFDGKNRVLIPFPTREAKSTLGMFVQFFDDAGWKADWDKGMISGTKEFMDTSPSALGNRLFGDDATGPKLKKMQMKIGKFLSKMKKMSDKYSALKEKLAEGTGSSHDPRYLTGKQIEEILGEEDTKQYYRLSDQINGYVGNDITLARKFTWSDGFADSMAQYWQQKADYIKKNLSSLDENRYSILITRHPVDILRMSDFDDINSCHSPPSRPQSEGSYYKCAVAEAHGHGAVAYVVNNSDLEEEFGTRNIRAIQESSAFQQVQDLFYDDARDEGGEIEPVSRLRLRQVRHFETATPKRHDEGSQIAVPERRIYGVKVPGFRDKVLEWARANQEEVLLKAPKSTNDEVDLGKFIKYGGSYEDNLLPDLIRDIYDDERFREFAKIFTGRIQKDHSTQQELERTLVLTNLDRVGREAAEIMGNYNLDNFEIELDYDEEEGNAYIIPTVHMVMEFDADEWIAEEKGRAILTHLPREFEDYGEGWDIFGTSEYDTSLERRGEGPYGVVVRMKVMVDKLGDIAGWMSPHDLEELMSTLYDAERSKYEGYKMIATGYLMREGALDGGETDRLGWAAENNDLDSGDWDVETEEGDHEPHRYELVTANMRLEISFENTTVEMLKKIIEEREFWLGIRTIMTKKSRGSFASEYQVDTDRFFDDIDEEGKVLYFRLNYHVGSDDNDDRARAWKALIETWNDEEELAKMIQVQFDKWVRAYGGPVIKSAKGRRMVESKLKIRSKSQEQRVFDKWRRFLK